MMYPEFTNEDAAMIQEIIRTEPADMEAMKLLSMISIVAEMAGEDGASERAKMLVTESVAQMVKKATSDD